MKTSNILLLVLIGSVTCAIVAGAMQMRFTGAKRSAYVEDSAAIDLNDFRYLVIRKSLNLEIIPSEKTQLVIRHGKYESKPVIQYHQKGDTLFLDEIQFGHESRTLSVTIETPLANLKWINADNSHFSMKDFPARSLRIELAHSRFYFYGENTIRIGSLAITGIDGSVINTHMVEIDTVELYLDRSEARMPDRIGKLRGSMTNNAVVFAPEVRDIELRKDSLSRWFQ